MSGINPFTPLKANDNKEAEMNRTIVLCIVIATSSFSMGMSEAHALSTIVGPGSDDVIYIGMVRSVLDGGSDRLARVCIDRPGSGGLWYSIGDLNGLDDDYGIYGDPTTGGVYGDDIIRTIPYTGYNPTGYCGTGGSAATTWAPLNYNGEYLDIYGGGADDEIYQYSSTPVAGSDCVGGDGNDYIYSLGTTTSFLLGGNGNDTVLSASFSSGAEWLWGQAGDDCISDLSSSSPRYGDFDCGTGTDRWNLSGSGNSNPDSFTCEGAEDNSCAPV